MIDDIKDADFITSISIDSADLITHTTLTNIADFLYITL